MAHIADDMLTEDEVLQVETLLAEDLLLGGDPAEIAQAVGVDPTRPLTDAEDKLMWDEQCRRKRQQFIAHVLACREDA